MPEPINLKKGDASLTELAGECFMLVLQIRGAEKIGNMQRLRSNCLQALEKFREDAQDIGHRPDDVQRALFALAGFMDEAVMLGPFENKDTWLGGLLQQELFDRNDAGEHFFRLLDEGLISRQPNPQVLQIFFLCLQMGFKGKHIQGTPADLQKVIEETKAAIGLSGSGRRTAILAPHGKPEEGIAELLRELPLWVIAASAAAVGILFFLVMGWLIEGRAGEIVTMIGKGT